MHQNFLGMFVMGCNRNFKMVFASSLLAAGLAVPIFAAPRQMEYLTRGLVASNVGSGMLVSWRLLGTDDPATEFSLYRDGAKIASIAKTAGTSYLDKDGKSTSKYEVAAIVDGKEQAKSSLSVLLDKTVSNSGKSFPYKTLKLEVPAAQKMPDGETCTYTPNDMSAADLDGDGEYELILKWDPSNAHDNSQTGYTGTVFIDAYKLDGKRLWRIDLGKNIRAGAHYTQFQVFDYDGDGKAEMIVKTADGTIDGTGKAIGNASADYRDANGLVLKGKEYLTVFRGTDGAAITTVDYVPSRDINQHVKGKNGKGYWGDNYGNRCERYIAATAYLDGVHPSAIFVRGYYIVSRRYLQAGFHQEAAAETLALVGQGLQVQTVEFGHLVFAVRIEPGEAQSREVIVVEGAGAPPIHHCLVQFLGGVHHRSVTLFVIGRYEPVDVAELHNRTDAFVVRLEVCLL